MWQGLGSDEAILEEEARKGFLKVGYLSEIWIIEGAGDVKTMHKSIPGRSNSRCKGPEARRNFPYLEIIRKARIIVRKQGVEQMKSMG